MAGYFTAFRSNGSSTYYGDNRTAARFDFCTYTIWILYGISCATAVTLVIGSRKHVVRNAVRYLGHIYLCCVILISRSDVFWLVTPPVHLNDCIYSHNPPQIASGHISVCIGLHQANITYNGSVTQGDSESQDADSFYYNEPLPWWRHRSQPYQAYQAARARGAPQPVQTVMEQFALLDMSDGSSWVLTLRAVGRCCSLLLLAALLLWLLSTFLLLSGHLRAYSDACAVLGALLALVCALYAAHVRDMVAVRFTCGAAHVPARLGHSYYLCASGIGVALWQAFITRLHSVESCLVKYLYRHREGAGGGSGEASAAAATPGGGGGHAGNRTAAAAEDDDQELVNQTCLYYLPQHVDQQMTSDLKSMLNLR